MLVESQFSAFCIEVGTKKGTIVDNEFDSCVADILACLRSGEIRPKHLFCSTIRHGNPPFLANKNDPIGRGLHHSPELLLSFFQLSQIPSSC